MATTKHVSSKVCYTLVSVCLPQDYVPVPAGSLAGPLDGPLTELMAGPLAGLLTGPMAGLLAGPLTGPMAELLAGPLTGPMAGPDLCVVNSLKTAPTGKTQTHINRQCKR